MNQEILYTIALTQIPQIGNITADKLINSCQSAEMVFKETAKNLLRIEHIPKSAIENIMSAKNTALETARREMDFIESNNIKVFLKSDDTYPKRLLECLDSPVVIYGKGNLNLNPKYSVSIVGTRKHTEYGSRITKKIVEDLATYADLQIISGLAYGIDTIAHQVSVQQSLSTVGVLGHGLNTLYPASNRQLAEKMLANGGVLTEFLHDVSVEAHNFPKRNRIIAGMSDAIVVVEAYEKGGALITVDIGISYNRDIFAVPGKVGDKASEGCNSLIKSQKSAMVTSGHDIATMMLWGDKPKKPKPKQIKLLLDLEPEEQLIVDALEQGSELNIDELLMATKINANDLSSLLLMLEFKGIVYGLPGKRYSMSLR